MKVILFTLLFASVSFTQNYFPDALNNRYQLYSENSGYSHGGNNWHYEEYTSMEIIKDTIIQGKRFVGFSGHVFYNSLLHYNQSEQKVYIIKDDSIRLALDFNVAQGDTFISYLFLNEPHKFSCEEISYLNILGNNVLSYRFKYQEDPFYHVEYLFSENYGFVFDSLYYWDPLYTSATTHQVVSAVIDSVVYHNISLNIDSIFPIINKPVNTFPLLLNGTYSTNINIVDTFYVKVTMVRGVDTLGTFSFPFEDNKAYLPLGPQVGDKLLLKAYISDKSIYNNYDEYPDSGYAEIYVLPPVVDVGDYELAVSFNLEQNYPNPFNPSTNIQYSIPERSFVSLIIYDAMGNEIARPVDEEKSPGVYNYQFDGTNLASGVYFYKLISFSGIQIRKMILMK